MKNQDKTLLIIACIFGILAIVLGAFGAHGLESTFKKNNIPLERLNAYHTGIEYHFYHTFAIFLSVLLHSFASNLRKIAGWFFIIGIIFFSGSLYLLSCRDLIHVPTSILGPLTPIGGTLFIIGWCILLWSIIKNKN